jgi:DNA-binding IclR family transcriptional regulator
MSDPKAASPPVARTLDVLEALVDSEDGLTLTELARKARVPLATCASIAYTLEQRGYAARTIVGRSHFWHATLGIYGLAARLIRNVDIPTVAQDELKDLANRIGMPVHIGVMSGASVVYVAKAASSGFVQFNTYPGKTAPYNVTALGKAIAANLDEERLRPLLGQMVVGTGPGAIATGVEGFLEQLAEVRSLGYAVEREEDQEDISCVAVPFFDASGEAAGAVGVTGFNRDLVGDTFTVAVTGLREIGQTISRKLGHRG